MKPKVIAPSPEIIKKTNNIIEKYQINTVCFASKCPNISECFKRGTATFMIMGNICTRNCRFCGVIKGKPNSLDENEPLKVAKAINELNLNYVVITSVDRDDLEDFGSRHFYKTIEKVKEFNPNTKIEALTPDFNGDLISLELISNSSAYKLAHNIETVERLHKKLKPKSSYTLSLKVLEYYSKFKITKSSKSSLPIVSITNALLKLLAVSLISSTAHLITLSAVSTPIIYSLSAKSLSILAGIPIKGILNSL